ncbi:MAG: response regulator [Treponema sp.]|nr:response regulator [Treponema sp.]
MKTIFIVDDSDTNLSMAEKVLENHYNVMTIPSAAKMFALLEKFQPDLILLDIEMPGMNGFEAMQRLKDNDSWTKIPVMFLTSRTDVAAEVNGFEMGAVDFITKPFSQPVLLNRIKTHLDIDMIIRERTAQLQRLQNGIVSVLADIVESRDKWTGGHIERTSIYIKILIDEMKERGVYADEMREWDMEKIISSARMHDLGKIVITDLILNKPDKLTGDEYEKMKTHTTEGEHIIDEIIADTGEKEFLNNAKLFAGNHHEHWDGTGYPRGLKGTNIPLQGRIMAIVDVYDALVSERSYKKAFTHEEAVDIIMQGAGTHYDPKITEVFFLVNDKFRTVGIKDGSL